MQVFPGPLALVRAEVERVQAMRALSAADAGFVFALADALSTLAARTGTDHDVEAIRTLKVRGGAAHTRASDVGTARERVLGLGRVQGHDLASSLRELRIKKLVSQQRGDGTRQSARRSNLQQTLVQTVLNI